VLDRHSLGLACACVSSVSDAAFEASQKAVVLYMPHPELALSLRAGAIASVFLGSTWISKGNLLKQIVDAARSSDFLKAWAVAGSINVAATQLML